MTSLPKNPKPHIHISEGEIVDVEKRSKKKNEDLLSEMLSLVRMGVKVRSESREAIR